ncbi:hypothetical protein F5Y03DRAFT_403375 [Xylaria venustula]|nr:hypothetical protein F5Y03DRAFT_403375 [Xylaria venustula]
MEQHRIPRRSASHGTLRSSYSSNGSSSLGPPPFRPLHKPLRSVNENSVLLHSPGALESMLKTTTETGDIGIFTIRPIPPSPLVPRETLSDFGHPYPRPRRSVDNLYRQTPAVRPPSHRDTISEVFSVYGSDSLKSGTSTLSPNSTDDTGQRSYSMTTCGSRHLSHHRSTNTLQSQASGNSHLQRPRSPFPYPTRLKRPGVRPASPAITENGRIDYSRMVEINRISYRTVHGHFKHAYSPMVRRPPPLGMRADINRSTPSLAPPGPPPNFHGPPRPPSLRAHSPASMASWNPPFHERFDSISTRTSSLTSVTNIYRRMPPTFKAGQSYPVQPPPRYYDYTEEFEDKDSQFSSLAQNLESTRPQTGRNPRPTGLREEDDHLATGHLAAVFGEGDSAFYDCESQLVDEQGALPVLETIRSRNQSRAETAARPTSRPRSDSAPSQNITIEFDDSVLDDRNARGSDIDLLPSQIGRESIDTFNPNLDLESRDIPQSYKCVTYHSTTTPKTQTKSPERHVEVLGGRAPTIHSEQGVILRDDTHHETPGNKTPGSCYPPAETNNDEPYSANEGEEPVRIDLGSQGPRGTCAELVGDKPTQTSLSPGRMKNLLPRLDPHGVAGLANSLDTDTVPETEDTMKDDTGMKSEKNNPEASKPKEFRRHRRNHAALRISTTNLPREDNEGYPHITPTCSTAPIISPKPISPARHLKVKNSIPKLMKALPPLPGALGYNLPSTTTDLVEEDDFAEILIPFSFHRSNECFQLDQSQPADPVSIRNKGVIPVQQKDGPKFKLRIKTASSSETLEPSSRLPPTRKKASRSDRLSDPETSDELGDHHMRNPNRNKMKVRSPQRSRLSSSHCSTVRRNPCIDTSRIITEIIRQKPQDLFAGSFKSDAVLLRKRRKPLSHLIYPQGAITCNVSDSTSSDQRVGSASCRMPSTASVYTSEMPAMDREVLVSSIPPRGLLKRLSNLRTLLSASTASESRVKSPGSLRIRKVAVNPFSKADSDIKSAKTPESPATESSQRKVKQRIRTRLSRWVRGARTAMRRCAKTKHKRQKQERQSKHIITHV